MSSKKSKEKKVSKSKTVNKEKEKKVKKRYKAFEGEYKGTQTIELWEVTKEGEKVGNFPLLGKGVKTWGIILKNIDKIQEIYDEVTE